MEDAVNIEINSSRTYVDHTLNSEQKLLSEVRRKGKIKQGKEKNEIQMEHENAYRIKALHARYFVATDDVRSSKSWKWLRQSALKKKTEGMIMAAQEQALRTRNVRKVIDKENINGMSRMCGEREETVAYIVCECKRLAQNEYKNWRHDKVVAIIYWELCKKYGVVVKERWYDHKAEKVIETDEIKISWDMRIQTEKSLRTQDPI